VTGDGSTTHNSGGDPDRDAARADRLRVLGGEAVGRARSLVAGAVYATRVVLSRRDGLTLVVGVGAAYLIGYLLAVGQLFLTVDAAPRVEMTVVSDPLARALEPTGPFAWEPVALVAAGPLELLVSPLNLLVGAGLAGLVGVNLAVSYLAYRHPAACGIDVARRRTNGPTGGSTGVLAGLPALLSGAACCGPVVLLAVGVQASGLLVSAFGVLVPLAVLLLVGSLLYVARSVDPTLARASSLRG
jgi:hypothetical protein